MIEADSSNTYQCGYQGRNGEAIIGFLRITESASKKRMRKITWLGAPGHPGRVLGSFTPREWRDQVAVNSKLRTRGLLWRRTKDEAWYEAARLFDSLKPLPPIA